MNKRLSAIPPKSAAEWAWIYRDATDLTFGEYAVLNAINSRYPEPHASYARIAQDAKCSRSTAIRHVDSAEAKGWLVKSQAKLGATNHYQQLLPSHVLIFRDESGNYAGLGGADLTPVPEPGGVNLILGGVNLTPAVVSNLYPKRQVEEHKEETTPSRSPGSLDSSLDSLPGDGDFDPSFLGGLFSSGEIVPRSEFVPKYFRNVDRLTVRKADDPERPGLLKKRPNEVEITKEEYEREYERS